MQPTYSVPLGLSRREFLKMATTVACTLLTGATYASEGPVFPSLGGVAERRNILFGFAVRPALLQSDSAYRQCVISQARIIVPENALKWENVHPERNRYDFSGPDVIAEFAAANALKMRGHTFCWHRSIPSWLMNTESESELEGVLREHIHTVAGRYRGHIQSWDVANEVINPSDGIAGGWRDSFWFRRFGPRFMDIACRALHEADPYTVICYNDYGLEHDDLQGQIKRRMVLSLLRNLQERGLPIGALGIQSHLKAGTQHPFGAGLSDFMTEVRSLGLQVYITELDVDDSMIPAERRDSEVAGVYKRYLELIADGGASEILTWGVWDTLHRTAATPYVQDKLATAPLLFGQNGKIKAASWAVLHALKRY